MKRRLLVLASAFFVVGAPACSRANAQEPETFESAPDLETQYREMLAAQAAAAAAEPAPTVVEVDTLGDEPFAPIDTAPANPCEEGELLWTREGGIEVCSRLCYDDADCALPEDVDDTEPTERCAGIDMGPPADGQTFAWENVEMPDGRVALGLCDVFWEDNPTIVEEPGL